MRTLLVTGSDTGVGKTHVVAALARVLANEGSIAAVGGFEATANGSSAEGGNGATSVASLGARHAAAGSVNRTVSRPKIQIVKVIETGRAGTGEFGDADKAAQLAGVAVDRFTLVTFPAAIAPSAAAAAVGQAVSFSELVAAVRALPPCDWRILEGAGGVATPIDHETRDWADFASAVGVDATIVVVPDRLGAINQGRLAYARAMQAGAPTGLWLNATAQVDPQVAASTRAGLRAAGIPIWAEQPLDAIEPIEVETVRTTFRRLGGAGGVPACRIEASESGGQGHLPLRPEAASVDLGESGANTIKVDQRCREALHERDAHALRRILRITTTVPGVLNLAGNDYLELARDPVVAEAVAAAARTYGTSASGSPLITGWGELHARLSARLAAWHGFEHGLLWSSGFAANSAVLGGLPERGDLVFADRLIHASMIAGLRRCGGRLQRYEHLNLDRLEQLLELAGRARRQVFVVTESVFSMDGDYPDLARMAELKRRYGFFWIVDEAHALGWYGPEGAGLVRAADVAAEVDVLIGTFGKTLASGGAYTLFHDPGVRDYLVNTAGEFIYSTALPPTSVAGAAAALERVSALASDQPGWHRASREFRARLQQAGWEAPNGDSPIIPVVLNDASAAVSLADTLRQAGILAAAVRPPTVPAGTSRLRFSLTRTFGDAEAARVLVAMDGWRAAR